MNNEAKNHNFDVDNARSMPSMMDFVNEMAKMNNKPVNEFMEQDTNEFVKQLGDGLEHIMKHQIRKSMKKMNKARRAEARQALQSLPEVCALYIKAISEAHSSGERSCL